jgi:hypothetical protein
MQDSASNGQHDWRFVSIVAFFVLREPLLFSARNASARGALNHFATCPGAVWPRCLSKRKNDQPCGLTAFPIIGDLDHARMSRDAWHPYF